MFLLIFFCNIPFVFFAGKVALLAVVHQCCYQKKEEMSPAEAANAAEAAENAENDQDDGYLRPAPINRNHSAPVTPGTGKFSAAMSEDAFSTSFVSQSVKGEVKPEDELPRIVYLTVIFTYLLIVALCAIFIDDLTLIFGIIAGLAECTTVFILPSIFYLIAVRQEKKKHADYELAKQEGRAGKRPPSKKGGNLFVIICVYVYLSCGIFYFAISNYFNFAKIFR